MKTSWRIPQWPLFSNPYTLFCVGMFFFLLGGYQSSLAQDSSKLRISLITCAPGEELYSTFGHTAIRIVDSSRGTDVVFNYGTFDFEDPNFYLKFVQGKLMYFLSSEPFADFAYYYHLTNRSVTEQVLPMRGEEKHSLREALLENLEESNKYYRYDFFFDNCTTRPLALLRKYHTQLPGLPDPMPAGTTFRQAIHHYLNQQGMAWSKFGIDLLLAAPTDAVMKPGESLFLPENLLLALDSLQPKQLVYSSRQVWPPAETTTPTKLWLTPMRVFIGLLLLMLALHWKSRLSPAVALAANGLENLVFFLTGFLGVVFVYMWVATDHAVCRENYHLLWAWPLHLFWPLMRSRKNRLTKYYGYAYTLTIVLVFLSWIWLPQDLDTALIPLLLLLAWRSFRAARAVA